MPTLFIITKENRNFSNILHMITTANRISNNGSTRKLLLDIHVQGMGLWSLCNYKKRSSGVVHSKVTFPINVKTATVTFRARAVEA
jgi:hypothetical protein